jgi:hypothetical protein
VLPQQGRPALRTKPPRRAPDTWRGGSSRTTLIPSIQGATHTGTSANQFHITGLPYTAKTLTGEDSVGLIGYWDSFTKPTNTQQAVAKVPAGANYVRFDALLTTGSPTTLSAANIPSALDSRWEFQITYECAAEALN